MAEELASARRLDDDEEGAFFTLFLPVALEGRGGGGR
jgi:hypothetical protein